MFRTAKQVRERSGRSYPWILADIVRTGLRFGAGYMDYLVFDMYLLNDEQKATYITRAVSNEYVKALNDPADWDLLDDKIEALKVFAGLEGRQWFDLRSVSEDEFVDRFRELGRIVAKVLDGTGGKGVEFFTFDATDDPRALYRDLRARGLLLIEQHLDQHPAIAALHPDSLNTLRLVTVQRDGHVSLVFAALRIGNGTRVDNLSSGGMAAIVDRDTGTISTPGADRSGGVYRTHPITGEQIVGRPIPLFAEARALVEEGALRIPRLGYVGWDIALTEDGPVLIEANPFPGHDFYQFQAHLGPDRIGLRPRFDRYVYGDDGRPSSD